MTTHELQEQIVDLEQQFPTHADPDYLFNKIDELRWQLSLLDLANMEEEDIETRRLIELDEEVMYQSRIGA